MCFSIAWMVAAELLSRKSVDIDCISLDAVVDAAAAAGSSSWLPPITAEQMMDKMMT